MFVDMLVQLYWKAACYLLRQLYWKAALLLVTAASRESGPVTCYGSFAGKRLCFLLR